jgi:hypothetical protein
MRPYGSVPRFFRHPYLRTGLDLGKRAAFEEFLASHGYRVAPVTIDNYDYVFAAAYDRELRERDLGDAGRILRTYVQYMDTVFGYYEAQSRALFGREPAHVLLLHVNNLNADAIDELLLMIRGRGYGIVPLDVALQDSVYQSPDTYIGAAGITWLHRWAITRGVPGSAFAGEPDVPEWIAGRPQHRPQ